MKYKIFYPTPMDEIDVFNDNIDVCVTLENGKEYTITVATAENLKELMRKDGKRFIEPTEPFAIVESITEENIKALIDKLVQGEEIVLDIYGGDLSGKQI